ncbi:MAG: carbohydrate kinase family protein [Planctomycetales bacterium]|nr:carbohydrate kinase family protein [Planctomycetales bacterium]
MTESKRQADNVDDDHSTGISPAVDIVVAGHICLDIIPTLQASQRRAEDLFIPGRLLDIGPATVSLGGSVANTGLALHRLGLRARLVGKVGADILGQATRTTLENVDPQLARGMVVAKDQSSSYTIVLNPPGTDRCFLHHSGTNNTFVADDLSLEAACAGRLVHFGYPPLMRGTYHDGGVSFTRQWRRFCDAGLVTSLDMAMPDPDSESGRVDWQRWLETTLPSVDIFLPSLDEILLMLEPQLYRDLTSRAGNQNLLVAAESDLLASTADTLLSYGASIVALKLGDQGFYLRTSGDLAELQQREQWSSFPWRAWADREIYAPCFQVDVVGTTGSGDCTVAGFLAGLFSTPTPEEAAIRAVGVGACNVESADATSGIPSLDVVEARIARGWSQRSSVLARHDWVRDAATGVWLGPRDVTRR